MTALAWLGFVAGAYFVLGAVASVMATLVVPRGLRSRLAAGVTWATYGAFHLAASRRGNYKDRDRILSLAGPSCLMAQIVTWVSLIYLGFALMFWPFTGPSLPEAFRVSGSSMFTLGFAAPSGAAPTALIFLAAALGLIVVALQIAYLPTLYSAFNRRETVVTLLESRGGVPAWGPEILARHELIDNVSSLADLYSRWEELAADLAESHTTYQALIYFRSPHPMRSWITGLLSVLDAAALHLSLNPLSAPPQARPFMRMGYMSLRDVAGVMQIAYNPDPKPEDPILLTREDFQQALDALSDVGWRWEREPDEAWVHFRGWRVTYESIAYAIAERLDAPPSLWSGSRHHRAADTLPPVRPPHRAPADERAGWREITEQRRSARAAEATPSGMPPDEAV